MKLLGLTQRIDNISGYSERRDTLDRNWYLFSFKLNFIPIPLPNLKKNTISKFIKNIQLDAIILTGGNSITSFDPLAKDKAPERDLFEKILIKNALQNNIPIIGICRGMQMINCYFGGKIKRVKNHVGVRHNLKKTNNKYSFPLKVNSFHNWTIPQTKLANIFQPIAIDKDGNVEAFVNEEKKILGIMWHPERDKPFNKLNIKLIKKFLL